MFDLWFERFNDLGGAWTTWMATATIEASIMLLIVGTIWFFIRGRVAPQVGVWLFLLVPLKLLIPIQVPAPAVIADWTPAAIVAKMTSPQISEPDLPLQVADDTTFAQPHSFEPSLTNSEAAFPAISIPQSDVAPQRVVETNDAVCDHANVVVAATNSGSVASNVQATLKSSLTLATLLMSIWALTVSFLGLRFFVREIRFRRKLRLATRLDNKDLEFDFQTLCESAGVHRPVRLLCCEAVAAPAVHGIFSPSVILPASTLKLSPVQLRWAVLHELAHIRRHDLAFILLQRVVSWLFFFHPAVWIANRFVHQLREFACDDRAILQTEQAQQGHRSTDAGEAFIQILRSASERSFNDVALSVLGLGPRKSCQQRLQRMLDTDRSINPGLGWVSACGLLIITAITLPQLSAANPQETGAEANGLQAVTEQVDDEAGIWRFNLSVVDTEGKAIPNAIVYLDVVQTPVSLQILTGKYLNESPDGDVYKCSDQGKLSIDFSAKPIWLQLLFRTDGYGRYRALWKDPSQVDQIPQEFTVQIERVGPIGGTVVDEDGNPVKDAEVSVFVKEKTRPGDVDLHGSDIRMKTDKQGRWVCRQFSEVQYDTNASINHGAFQWKKLKIKRPEFEIASSVENHAGGTIKLSKGSTVSGRVVNGEGKPIAGVTVRTESYFSERQAISGKDGRYTISGCSPSDNSVVATSPGMAVEEKSVFIESDLKDVDFVLKPSKGIRVRFVDEVGKPRPGLEIRFENWRGKDEVYSRLRHVSKNVDDNGVWEWKEAPLDEFSILINTPLSEWDGTPRYQFRRDVSDRTEWFLGPQELLARQEEYVITVPKTSVSGKVVDAVTGEKIKSFRVTLGSSQQQDQQEYRGWNGEEMRIGFDGSYRIPHTNHICNKFFFRIDAAGYRSVISRDITRDEGDVTLDFKLQPAATTTTQILDAKGQPASDAVVVVATASSVIAVRNGYLKRVDDGLELRTDEQGKVTFSPSGIEPFQLLILHDQGFASVTSEKMTVPQQIKLTQWAVLEGKFLSGQQPAKDVRVTLNARGLDSRRDRKAGTSGVGFLYDGVTDRAGDFRFDRVAPGDNSVGFDFARFAGVSKKFVAVSGETRKLQVGGAGIPVVGRLRPPKGHDGSMDFEYANLSLKSEKLSDDSQESDSVVFFHAVARSDGSFRMDHVPSGDWVLTSSHQAMIGPDLIKFTSDPIQITIAPDNQVQENVGDLILKEKSRRKMPEKQTLQNLIDQQKSSKKTKQSSTNPKPKN